jgi:hypothetical protein
MSALRPRLGRVDDSDRTEQAEPAGEPSPVEPEASTRASSAQDPTLVLLEAILRELRLLRAHVAADRLEARRQRGGSVAGIGYGVWPTRPAALGVDTAGDGEPR